MSWVACLQLLAVFVIISKTTIQVEGAPVGCRIPDGRVGTEATYNSTMVNSTAVYWCKLGYRHSTGDYERTCGADHQWTGAALECMAVGCGIPDGRVGSEATYNSTMVNSTAVYWCKLGYRHRTGDYERTCGADEQWTGAPLECTDSDECLFNMHTCIANSTCINNVGSFTCVCRSGFTGNGTVCTDVDECTENMHNCMANSNCRNSVGSFNCSCGNGFMSNGTHCTGIPPAEEQFDITGAISAIAGGAVLLALACGVYIHTGGCDRRPPNAKKSSAAVHSNSGPSIQNSFSQQPSLEMSIAVDPTSC